MIEKLIECMNKNNLVSIFSEAGSTSFSLGYIDAMDTSYIRLKYLSNDGLLLGYELIRINDIFRIEENSDYHKKIEFLHQNFKGKYTSVNILNQNDQYNSVMIETLSEFQKQRLVVELNIEDDNIIGVVKEILDDYITILVLDDYGQTVEETTILVKKINTIDGGNKELQIIQFLFENNYS